MKISSCLSLTGLASLVVAALLFGQASRPSYPPGLREEARGLVNIGPAKDCQVEVTGTIAIGPSTSGPGTLLFRNLGAKPVAALSGTLEYVTRQKRIHSVRWKQNFVSISSPQAAYIAPGEEASIPTAAGNITSPNDPIVAVSVTIAGVLYGDGSTCGEEGQLIRNNFLSSIARFREDLELVLRAAELEPREEFEKALKAGVINLPGRAALNARLRSLLLDANGRLKADFLDLLRSCIRNLDHPFGP